MSAQAFNVEANMRDFARQLFRRDHRIARLGSLGTLAMSMTGRRYLWFLAEVYDLRFPHVGDERHALNGVRSFDSLRSGFRCRLWSRIAGGR